MEPLDESLKCISGNSFRAIFFKWLSSSWVGNAVCLLRTSIGTLWTLQLMTMQTSSSWYSLVTISLFSYSLHNSQFIGVQLPPFADWEKEEAKSFIEASPPRITKL